MGNTQTMTWTDAAEQLLKEAGKPLPYRGLAEDVIRKKLVSTKSKTPHITLHASIVQENRIRGGKGLAARFAIERGIVSLIGAAATNVVGQLRRKAEDEITTTKKELLKRLMGLAGDSFETFVEYLLIQMGYEDVERTGGPGDEGIDFLCEMSIGVNRIKTAVQVKCKKAHNKIGPKDVRNLRDVLTKYSCSQGVFITTSDFDITAREAANEQGKLPVVLINGEVLSELAIEYRVGVRKHDLSVYEVDTEFELFGSAPARRRRSL